jgi:hypothetical protein
MSTWDLMMQSFGVLRRDKQLVIFPVLSAIAAIAISVPFVLALFASGEQPHEWTWNTVAFCLLWYFCCNAAIIFFNCALAASAQIYFDGGTPTLGQGISQAATRAPAILAWALVTSFVGVFLRWVDERSGLLGKIVVGLIGVAWNVATYLIVPVLVIEDVGVMDAIRRSSELLKKTWGEQLISVITFGWFGLLCAVPGIIIGAIGFNGFWPLIPVAVLYFMVMMAAFSAAAQIFRVALYRYAITGEAPNGFTTPGLQGAMRPR